MVIQHNLSAISANNRLQTNQSELLKRLEKLSSGYSINRAGDNAAGLAISESMRGKIAGLSMATNNAQDGISLLQTADGALGKTHTLLQVMSKMSVLAANASYSDIVDRAALQLEFEHMMEEINDIAGTTDFNRTYLLDGSLSGNSALKFMLSEATVGEEETFSVEIDDMSCEGLGIDDCSIETSEKANKSIDVINSAIDKVSLQRGKIGAVEKRIEHKYNVLSTTTENLTAFESQIRDADIASEMMEFTKYEILSGSAQAMVAQANAEPMKVVDLLTNSAVKADVPAKKTVQKVETPPNNIPVGAEVPAE
ncbi:MAG: flagellin [Oscillospiraceae bacterium]|nr:flagellin [Oscillospiraceae bacterium]